MDGGHGGMLRSMIDNVDCGIAVAAAEKKTACGLWPQAVPMTQKARMLMRNSVLRSPS
jgi:hypothetical protein